MPRQGVSVLPESSGNCSKRDSCRNIKTPISELPVEILLKIFDYFDPHFLVNTVSFVCKRFTSILRNDGYWRCLYFRTLKGDHTYESCPILERYGVFSETWRMEPDIFWRDLTMRLVTLQHRWTKPINSIKLHSTTETVDTVHILQDNKLCITGSSEKCIDLWAIDFRPYIKSSIIEAHKGCVSCIQSFERDSFLSGSLDSTVSYWNIKPTMCEAVWTFDCGKPVTSVDARPGLVVAGVKNLSGGQLVLIDPRIRQTLASFKYHHRDEFHSKPTVDAKLRDNYVVSVGRDSKLCSFDLRQQSVVSQTDFKPQSDAIPNCMAIRNNIVYVGDTKGCMYLFDAQRSFEIFQKITIRHRDAEPHDCKISSICPELGAVIVGCSDGTVHVVVPTEPVYEIKTVEVEHEVTSMSYRKSVLAVAKNNGEVDVFRAGMQGTLTIFPLTQEI